MRHPYFERTQQAEDWETDGDVLIRLFFRINDVYIENSVVRNPATHRVSS